MYCKRTTGEMSLEAVPASLVTLAAVTLKRTYLLFTENFLFEDKRSGRASVSRRVLLKNCFIRILGSGGDL